MRAKTTCTKILEGENPVQATLTPALTVFCQTTKQELSVPRLANRTNSRPRRDDGMYDSSDRLPDITRLLHRSQLDIEHALLTRGRKRQHLSTLWKRVTKTIDGKFTATEFRDLKFAKSVRNQDEIDRLNHRYTAAIAEVEPFKSGQGFTSPREDNMDTLEAIQLERAALKPVVKFIPEDLLEIALAYWFEAANAASDGLHDRSLHALIECHRYIGSANSLKTESESKSEQGAASGRDVRHALAAAINIVIKELEPDVKFNDTDFLFGLICIRLEQDSRFADVVSAYETLATKGKRSINSQSARLTETIRAWCIQAKREPKYPHLVASYKSFRNLERISAAKQKAQMTARKKTAKELEAEAKTRAKLEAETELVLNSVRFTRNSLFRQDKR